MPRDLRALPKANLHLHLTGSMRPSTAAELAAYYGLPPLPAVPIGHGLTALQDLSRSRTCRWWRSWRSAGSRWRCVRRPTRRSASRQP